MGNIHDSAIIVDLEVNRIFCFSVVGADNIKAVFNIND